MSEPWTFTWDGPKSDANLAERGFDFDYAIRVFDGETVQVVDDRDYPELRIWAFGLIEGLPYRVTYTPRTETQFHIISAHRIRWKEYRKWQIPSSEPPTS